MLFRSAGELGLMEALGLQDLRADEGEGVHGMCLVPAAPFPAALTCVPQGDERVKTVATATSVLVSTLYRIDGWRATLTLTCWPQKKPGAEAGLGESQMEPRRLELLTPCMPCRCSTS